MEFSTLLDQTDPPPLPYNIVSVENFEKIYGLKQFLDHAEPKTFSIQNEKKIKKFSCY